MKKSDETKKILYFIFIPLVIFTIPLFYWIQIKVEEKSIVKNKLYVIGKVSSSNYQGYKNIVRFEYDYENKTYTTDEFEFNWKKPLPIALPIIIEINKKNPELNQINRDSTVRLDSFFVKYYHELNGGWTYKITPVKLN